MSKIYLDLTKSTYFYKTKNFTYIFSSELYLNKFIDNLKDNRIKLKNRLESRFRIKVNLDDYFDFILYDTIEKRGFLIKTAEGDIFCLKEVTLNGGIKI